ncbi:alpha/beta hydrolase [Acinetobacter seifertii]|uniref:alpha/beta hydrolase n=2 Tax=Acinetobacter seifertii TaxID=1530123 RepID=UPI00168CC64A|nr:alpha/beta hydrolase [Acinetobacter seifertii]MDB0280963.1 alpha/beta hydrolase [Acinetobacter seifertii]QNX31633.1 alpha/beta hydrolase [Acinetobacter seifertii]QNY28927.1 alpha/beta hydrolase [Acinetobacter seifertii]
MRQYDNATTVANEGEILASFQSRSLLSYQAYHHIKDIKYGSQNRSTMDFFPLEHANKTVIFIHGGYWQWCDKSDFAFIAPYILAKGAQCVLVEYDLAPQSHISQIVAQTQKALDFIAQQNWKTDEVLLVGHSAGAHLGALCLSHPLLSEVALLSGIYDLAPIQATHLNHALKLSQDDILKCSPIHREENVDIPCMLLSGELELSELKWQSENYFDHKYKQNQNLMSLDIISEVNHYSILDYYFKYIFK